MAFKPLDLNWALTAALPPFDFVLPGLLPGAFGLLVAPGATGKSQLALDIAISISLGRASAGGLFPATPPAKVVMLAGEEGERVLAERIRANLDLNERATPSLYDYLTLLPMAGETCTLIEGGKTTALFSELSSIATGARLIIIDPLRRMHNGDENNSAEMTAFVVAMEQLARATGAAVLGLHHANRASSADASSQNAARGSSAYSTQNSHSFQFKPATCSNSKAPPSPIQTRPLVPVKTRHSDGLDGTQDPRIN